MEKIVVDADRCIRCGACMGWAPDVFDQGEDGESVVINNVVDDRVRQAVDMCPVYAIEIVEEDEEKNEEEVNE